MDKADLEEKFNRLDNFMRDFDSRTANSHIIDLSDSCLDDDKMKILTRFLTEKGGWDNSRLTHIDLSNNDIESEGVGSLKYFLHHLPRNQLKFLDLSRNRLKRETKKDINGVAKDLFPGITIILDDEPVEDHDESDEDHDESVASDGLYQNSIIVELFTSGMLSMSTHFRRQSSLEFQRLQNSVLSVCNRCKYAVVIGVDKYAQFVDCSSRDSQESSYVLNDLHGSNDAMYIGRGLTTLGFEFEYLVNEDATAENIGEAVHRITEKSTLKIEKGESPIIVFYFAGHGFDYGGEPYIVPYLGKTTQMKKIQGASLSIYKMVKQLASLKESMQYFVLDCCRQPIAKTSNYRALNTNANLMLIYATLRNQPAGETDIGLFTKSLLRVVQEMANNMPALEFFRAARILLQSHQISEVRDRSRLDFVFNPHPRILRECHRLNYDVGAVLDFFEKNNEESDEHCEIF